MRDLGMVREGQKGLGLLLELSLTLLYVIFARNKRFSL